MILTLSFGSKRWLRVNLDSTGCSSSYSQLACLHAALNVWKTD
jgi:hypothetical protein